MPFLLALLILLGGAVSSFGTDEDAVSAPSDAAADPALVSARPDCDHLDELVAEARRRRLWNERYWRLLLHYRKGVRGTFSEAGWDGFFFSGSGRKSPQAELEATLAAFFAPAGDPDQSAQCRFPARYAWLKQQLPLDTARVPEPACPAYRKWRDELDVESVSIVFASSHLGNPSSMYGHTFLLLHKRGNEDWLLDTSINFAADVNTGGLLYMIYGLAGVFPGRFSALPYYMKVQQYNIFESRDLWEYRLGFRGEAIERLMLHLWEMDKIYFPYYFFNKNCSYQLLPLLEVAEPSLRLTDRWPLYVIPANTIRAILKQPGLVTSRFGRASQITRMIANRKRLAKDEVRLVEDLADPRSEAAFTALADLPRERQAPVLDSASEYLEYRLDYRRQVSAALEQRQREIHLARGRLGVPTVVTQVAPDLPPEAGHRTTRVALSTGGGSSRFEGVAFRFSLHDLLDRSAGYRPNSTLELGQLELRRDRDTRALYVERLDLVKIVSLPPRDRWTRPKAWKLGVGLETAPELDRAPSDALYARLNFGMGRAVQAHVAGRELFYAMVEVDAGIGGVFEGDTRWGGGVTAGVLLEPAPWWRLHAEAGAFDYVLGDRRGGRRFLVEQSVSLTRDVAVRFRWQRRGSQTQHALSLQKFF